MESKRQNKLLKLAISRLQQQVSSHPQLSVQAAEFENNGETFLTESKQPVVDKIEGKVGNDDAYGISKMMASQE
jgi:hypothetical protein